MIVIIWQEKKVELKETLVMELKEKKGNIETERQTMDLNNGGMKMLCLFIFPFIFFLFMIQQVFSIVCNITVLFCVYSILNSPVH